MSDRSAALDNLPNADDPSLHDDQGSSVAIANALAVEYARDEHAGLAGNAKLTPSLVKLLVQTVLTAACADADVCKTIVQVAGVVPGGAGVAATSTPAALPGATAPPPNAVTSGIVALTDDPVLVHYRKNSKLAPPTAAQFDLNNPRAFFDAFEMFFLMSSYDVRARGCLFIVWTALPEHVRNCIVTPAERHSLGCGVRSFADYEALKAAVLSYFESRAQDAALAKLQAAVAKPGRVEQYSATLHTTYHVLAAAWVPSDAAMLQMIRQAMPATLKGVPAFMFKPATSDAWLPSEWADFLVCMVQADRTLRQGHQAGGTLHSGGSGGSAGPSSGPAAKKSGSAVVGGPQHPLDGAVHHQGGGGHQGSVSRKRKGSETQGMPNKRVVQASVAPPVPLQNAAPRPSVPLAQRKCYKCGQLGHLIKNCPSN